MIKILFFIPDLIGGGAEKVLRNLVNNMDQSQFDITVHTISEKKNPEEYLVKGIHYKAINCCKTKFGKRIFHYLFRFCAEFGLAYPLFIKEKYDIEVAYLECGATKVLASSNNKKALKIAWVHCDLSKRQNILKDYEKVKKQYKKYNKVICVSEEVKKSFDTIFDGNFETVVLHNVNDEQEILDNSEAFEISKINEKCFRILSVGRLSYEKGNDRLIEACRILKEKGYLFELMLVGEGPERGNLENLIKKYCLEDSVKLIGFVDNPYPYMMSADIVVCPSRYEGFSTVITECMILGKAVVTTPCAGMREILGESEYGIIAKDNIKSLASEIQVLLDSPEKIEYFSNAAKERGKFFSKKEVVSKTESYFKEELRRHNVD